MPLTTPYYLLVTPPDTDTRKWFRLGPFTLDIIVALVIGSVRDHPLSVMHIVPAVVMDAYDAKQGG